MLLISTVSTSLFLNLSCMFVFYLVPEEFMYNPVSRSYGEPHKRPEVQNATIEFIAPSEYMVSLGSFFFLLPFLSNTFNKSVSVYRGLLWI